MATLDAYRRAIGNIESRGSGGYSAIGPTHPKYGRALGAYQVMESNLPQWSQEAIGRQVSPDEFLANPQIQDSIFNHRFGSYLDKTGNPNDAASMWFTGRPASQGGQLADVNGTTGSSYVQKFNKELGAMGEAFQTADATNSTDGSTDPRADMPVEGGQEVQFKPPGGSGDSSGFPGGMFGPNWNAGDAMYGAGLAMMARDNPTGAAALAQALRYGQTGQKKEKQAVKYDQKTGKGVIYDPNKGEWTETQVTSPAPPEANAKLREMYDKHVTSADQYQQVLDKMNKYRDMIADNKLDLDWASKLDTGYRNLMGTNLTEGQRNALNFMADIEDMRNQRLLDAKGVQTEGDAQRAMNAIAPGQSLANKHAVLGLLDRASGDLSRATERNMAMVDPLVKKYGNDLVGDVDLYNSRRQTYKTNQERFEQTFAPKREAFFRQADQNRESPPLTGRNPMQGGGSIADKIRAKYGRTQ
jgi:hypothetical protein